DWTLLAAHVRTNHVHVVVAAHRSAEQVMNAFKAYASRALNGMAPDEAERKRWARHGSTRHLWTRHAVSAAVHYVVWEQGQPMASFEMLTQQAAEKNTQENGF
ncbi:MAG: transposase, partial [Bryobacteraceae bacterium]|nr:transposase [Bryobacteraceae bacterium]